jgi:hypothetical protein
MAAFQMASGSTIADDDACYETALYAQKACYNSANEAYNLALGKCGNIGENKQDACETEAYADKQSALAECREQFAARQDVCKDLG